MTRITRADLVDVLFATALVALGIIGFRTAFAGHEEIAVGLPSVALGIAVGFALAKARPQLLVGAAVAIVAFFLLAGVAGLRAHAPAGFLPSPAVWSDLIDGAVNGWARLLTTVPPAGKAGNLLAVLYLAGYAGGVLSVALAVIVRRWPLCVIPPLAVLGVSVLFGVDHPASLFLQGALFGCLTIAWLSLRGGMRHATTGFRVRRLAAAAAVLAVTVLGAFVIGPRLPMAGANPRYLLRDNVQPPFDPSQYPTPLGRFREYHGEDPIRDPLFTVEGLPQGQAVRFAVMDSYDGYVWRASPPATATGGTYERVGPRIPTEATGAHATLHFTMGALASADSVWVPTAGATTSVTFSGPNAERLSDDLRFNRVTESAADPVALRQGDQWTVEAVFATPPPKDELRTLGTAPGAVIAKPQVNDRIASLVDAWIKDKTTPYDKVIAIEAKLREIGAYNDGTHDNPIASGHSLGRLIPFLEADQPQGNGEQYAAAVAYLAQSLGIPARVVLEFVPSAGTGSVEVKAHDARAMVEIALDRVGWVAVDDPTPPEDHKPKQQVEQQQQTSVNEVQPPPPTTAPPPNSLPENPAPEKRDLSKRHGGGAGAFFAALLRLVGYASIPLAVVLAPCAVIVGLKARRRKRRRTVGPPAARVTGAWLEVVDLARDLGTPVPRKATRREIGRFVPELASTHFSDDIDAIVFGSEDPTDYHVDRTWRRADELRLTMLTNRSRSERLRGSLSLTSLR